MGYKVTAAYVTAKTNTVSGEAVLGFYRGAVLPADVPQEQIDHLLDVGMILDEDAVPTVSALSTDDDLKSALADDPDGPGGVPAKSALKEEWVAYAVTQGASEEEASALTKDDLIAAYGAK